jgi:hypothetical protein
VTKTDMLERLNRLRRCISSLPEDVQVVAAMPQSAICEGHSAVFLLHPLPEFDVRQRMGLDRVRYMQKRPDAWVYWVVIEQLPESL